MNSTHSRIKSVGAYVGMIGGAALLYLLIRSLGSRLVAPEGDGFGKETTSAAPETLLHVLLALIVVIVAARAVGALFRRIQQPPVMGEVVAGIVLGPSLLGRFAPRAAAYLLPQAVAPYLGVIAQVGVILFMFLVGLELDTALLRKKPQATLFISHASIAVPLVLGSALALWLYPRTSTNSVPFGVFALFIGVSMSVTAFPVLARILTDRGIQKTRIGVLALSCAAVDDVTAWCLLAFVVSIAKARMESAIMTAVLALVYGAGMLFMVRPFVLRFVQKQELTRRPNQTAVAIVLVGLLVSALLTEYIGIHALFGAFLLGAIIPHDSSLAKELTQKFEDIVVVLLLPAFFAFTGMRTQIGLLGGAEHWMMCAAIVAVACAGKFGGTTLAARLTGIDWRDAASIGVLMNTRGLMELIVLNIGLDLHVISPPLFTMLVLMAILTTFATTPVLHWLTRGRPLSAAGLSTGR